ncbi:MAG: hypothetical protein NWE86_00385 [Candidatus Bathyarchaeota archaeon]|nr:hypothetical protein [Candidatus Bathyarchaeota archaeon]
MNLSIKRPIMSAFFILFLSTSFFTIQPLNATPYTEGNSGGGVGDPLDYGANYDSNVNVLQGTGYAYAHGEQIPGFLGESWAWFWLADSWTCKKSGTYEIIMEWSYNGETILENHEFPLSTSTSSAKALLHLFVESPYEISEKPQSTELIFSKYLNDRWKEESFSINGRTELRYEAYFEKGKIYRLRGALEVIVFSRWIAGISWGSSTININGRLEEITILSEKHSVTTSIAPAGSGHVTGGSTYSLSETCKLTAHANENYEFDYWGGDISGEDNPKTFIVNKDINAIAHFKKIDAVDFNIEVFSLDKTNYEIGEMVKLFAKIKNTGTNEIPPSNVEARFVVITPSGKHEDMGINYNFNSIAKGDTDLFEASWEIPINAETGCYDIEVTINVKNGPIKSDRISSALCLEICQPPELKLFTPEIDDLFVKVKGITEPGCSSDSISRIHWDWGDGYEGYSWFPATHYYESEGNYTILVTSYQSDDQFTKESFTVTVDRGEQLDVQILAPKPTVTVLPTNLTIRVTSKGLPVPNAEVAFYQVFPGSGFIGSVYTGSDGLASYTAFQQLDVGTTVTWFAIVQKIGYLDGKSQITAFTYQPCDRLEVQILKPASVVTSTPITFTVKVTCGGQPVSDAIVDFYQDAPDSRPMELGVVTDINGTASYTAFIDGLPPDYNITWHVIGNKLGYQDGRANGRLVHHYAGAPSVSDLLTNPVYDTEVRIYGKVNSLGELRCPCFELTSGGGKLLVWYDLMIVDNETERPQVSVDRINNGDWVILTGELKQEGQYSSLNDFWISSIQKID